MNWQNKFNELANKLIAKQCLNRQGIAAIDHANMLYEQSLSNSLSGSTLDTIFVQSIDKREFPNSFLQKILDYISNGSLQLKSQGHLSNGYQTSGNLFDLSDQPFQALKELLILKIDKYNQLFDVDTDKEFKKKLENNLCTLRGWAIIMNSGGSLRSHNHETGWLTGTFYLQMPEKGSNLDEGAIEFSHQGPKYPAGDSSLFEKKLIRPSVRDLTIFSSSLFHRTLPFRSSQQRICIAFDVVENKKL